jgi:activator of 2-hydroxyglutaryl-CoA dehydratase
VLALYIESDIMDQRVVSEAQLKNRIDAFFEGLDSRRLRTAAAAGLNGGRDMIYAGGVDVGSTQTKAVVIDADGGIVGRSLIDTGANVVTAAERAFDLALRAGGLGATRSTS